MDSQNKSLTGESASEEFAQQVHEESNPDVNLSQRSLITKRVAQPENLIDEGQSLVKEENWI